MLVAHRACVAVDDYGADIEGAYGLDGDRGERLIDLAWVHLGQRGPLPDPGPHQLYSRRML